MVSGWPRYWRGALAVASTLAFGALTSAGAQSTAPSATVRGIVRDADGQRLLAGVLVLLDGRQRTASRTDGRFQLDSVPPGAHVLGLRRLGFRPKDIAVTLTAGEVRDLALVFDAQPVPIGLVTVFAASRRPERLLDAPAAITVVAPERLADLAPLGQTPLLVADLPGVHVQQSGAYEFNLNTRGFNFTNNRRVLVLVDGRDISVPLLGNQEWSDFSLLDEASRVELVRGPGSALYGSNAFGGVLAIATPSVRASQGLRVGVEGGLPNTGRADVRYGVLSDNAQWGARLNVGAMRGASWDRSRTDSLALQREYAGASVGTPRAPAPGYEFVPLIGQRTNAPLGVSAIATGDIDPTQGWYGSARVDRYGAGGATLTAEGGIARTEHLLATVSTGRSQTLAASRPWARLAYNDSAFTIFAYYNARTGDGSSLSLPSIGRDQEYTLHVEGQFEHPFAGTRGRVTLGASARQTTVNTFGTLLSAAGDGSSTSYQSAFGQLEYAVRPSLRAIVAVRGDIGSRDARQLSPKVGVVWSLGPNQSLRATVAQGYLVAPILARYLDVAAGPPLDLRALEGGLRASPLGPALQGVPAGALFGTSAAVPLRALGNTNLRPERVSSYELGYKGQFQTVFVSADAYVSRLDGFLSPLLPGGNPAYGRWTAPTSVPEIARGPLQDAVLAAVGRGLTRLADGNTAFVLSGGNAGRADEHGVEFETQWRPSAHWHADVNYTWYAVSIKAAQFIVGDTVRANTPANSGNASLTYEQSDGLRARIGVRVAEAFDWRSALWVGRVPSMTTVDAVIARPLTPSLSASMVATNLLDQARFQFFGGSLVRRRVLASLTWRP